MTRKKMPPTLRLAFDMAAKAACDEGFGTVSVWANADDSGHVYISDGEGNLETWFFNGYEWSHHEGGDDE